MHRSRLALLLAVAAASGGCAHGDALRCTGDLAPMVQERLYFGTERPRGGDAVTEGEWRAFVDEVVAPAFPDGFTTWNAAGGWRGADGRPVREPGHVLEIVHAAGATADAAVGKVAAGYNARFDQDAVMRIRTPTCVAFVQAR